MYILAPHKITELEQADVQEITLVEFQAYYFWQKYAIPKISKLLNTVKIHIFQLMKTSEILHSSILSNQGI